MNINELKLVINSTMTNELKERAILTILSQDNKVIPHILEILQNERATNKELLLDTNMELSRALIVLNDDNLKPNKKVLVDPKWVAGEIFKHYIKWKDYIRCNFKFKQLEDID